jgi:hypothetical protein
MVGGRIANIEPLQATDDTEVMRQADAIFRRRSRHFTGYEIWHRDRRVHAQISH